MQNLDIGLPREALEAVLALSDAADIAVRYREPIVALQDMDLALSTNAEFAYYAIYNAFRRYALNLNIEEALVVDQALSALPSAVRARVLLAATSGAA